MAFSESYAANNYPRDQASVIFTIMLDYMDDKNGARWRSLTVRSNGRSSQARAHVHLFGALSSLSCTSCWGDE